MCRVWWDREEDRRSGQRGGSECRLGCCDGREAGSASLVREAWSDRRGCAGKPPPQCRHGAHLTSALAAVQVLTPISTSNPASHDGAAATTCLPPQTCALSCRPAVLSADPVTAAPLKPIHSKARSHEGIISSPRKLPPSHQTQAHALNAPNSHTQTSEAGNPSPFCGQTSTNSCILHLAHPFPDVICRVAHWQLGKKY